jgi:hypothetical protein
MFPITLYAGQPNTPLECQRVPLARLLLLRLESLLAVAPYHNGGEKAANNSRSQHDENDWNADSPDAGEKEGLKHVVLVDEGLDCC